MPLKALPTGLYSYTYPPGSIPVEVYVFEDPNDGTCWRFKNNKFSHRLDTSPHNVPIVVWPKCLEPIVPKNPIPTSLPFPANVPCPRLLDPMEAPKLPDDATQLAKLPRTAEGVLVVPGMTVWSKPSSGPPHSFLVHSIYEGKQIGLWLPANGYAVAAASDKCYYIKPTE